MKARQRNSSPYRGEAWRPTLLNVKWPNVHNAVQRTRRQLGIYFSQFVIRTMKIYSSSLFLLAILTTLAQAQQSPRPLPKAASSERQSPVTAQSGNEVGEGEVVRITASLVSVPVSVIDRQGAYVVDLQQKDFRIYEDGVE